MLELDTAMASSDTTSAPTSIKFKVITGLILFFGLGAILGGLWTWRWYQDLRPVALGDPFSWESAEAKQRVADALSKVVTLPDFLVGVHLVKSGENYWSVARDAGVDIDTLVGCNPELKNLDAWMGQPLLMVNQRGAIHIASEFDTEEMVARRYGIEPEELLASNKMPWYGLREGQVLFIPGAKPGLVSKDMENQFAKRKIFRSPLEGRYTSLIGSRRDPFTGVTKRHNGVDIKAKFNAPVAAAAGGTVIFSGWKGGYGKCVIIKHKDGYQSLYGHLNKIHVRVGQKITQHHPVGKVGMTGRTTGPHLHFTIWKDKKLKDPLQYLW